MKQLIRIIALCAAAIAAFATDPNPPSPVTRVNRLISLAPSGKIELDSELIFRNHADLVNTATTLGIAGGVTGVHSLNGNIGVLNLTTLAGYGITDAQPLDPILSGLVNNSNIVINDTAVQLSLAELTCPIVLCNNSFNSSSTASFSCADFGAGGTPITVTAIPLQTGNMLEFYDPTPTLQTFVDPSFNLDMNGHEVLEVGAGGITFVNTGAADTRTNLGLVIGTNVQAYNANLTTFAGIAPSANVVTMLGASNYAAVRTDLGLVIGTNVQAYNANLTTFAGIAPSANVQTLLGAANYAAINTDLGLGSAATHPATDFLAGANNLSDLGSAATARNNIGWQSSRLGSDTSNSSSSTHAVIWSFSTVSGGNYHIIGKLTCTGGSTGQHPNFCLHGITVTSMALNLEGASSSTSTWISGADITAVDSFTSVGYVGGASVTGSEWFDCTIENASTGTASIDFVTSSNGTSVTIKKNASAECFKTN